MRRDRVTIRGRMDKGHTRQLASMACFVFKSLGGTEQNSNHKANAQEAAPQILWQPHQYLLHFEETKKWEWLPWAVMLSSLHRDLTTDKHWGFQWSVPALHQVWTTAEETSEVNFLFFLLKNRCTNSVTSTFYSLRDRGREISLLTPGLGGALLSKRVVALEFIYLASSSTPPPAAGGTCQLSQQGLANASHRPHPGSLACSGNPVNLSSPTSF